VKGRGDETGCSVRPVRVFVPPACHRTATNVHAHVQARTHTHKYAQARTRMQTHAAALTRTHPRHWRCVGDARAPARTRSFRNPTRTPPPRAFGI